MNFGETNFNRLTPQAKAAFDKHRAGGMTRSQAFQAVYLSHGFLPRPKPKQRKGK